MSIVSFKSVHILVNFFILCVKLLYTLYLNNLLVSEYGGVRYSKFNSNYRTML